MTPARSLPSELTIYTVGELRPQWLAWLADTPAAGVTHKTYDASNDASNDAANDANEDSLPVDAAAVAEVDAAGVQLLVSLQRALEARQQALRLMAPSRALATACTALGLAALVGAVGAGETAGAPA